MSFSEVQPGLILVTYRSPEEMAVTSQSELITRLEAPRSPAVLVFDVQAGVRAVPIDVPTFWLGVTARPGLHLAGMAIVSKVTLVRVAARGFALANVARGLELSVDTFSELDPALAWARQLLSARGG